LKCTTTDIHLKSGTFLSGTICYGKDDKSKAGWSLSLQIVSNRGRDLSVRQEIDNTLEIIRKKVAEQIGEDRTTVERVAFYVL